MAQSFHYQLRFLYETNVKEYQKLLNCSSIFAQIAQIAQIAQKKNSNLYFFIFLRKKYQKINKKNTPKKMI